MPPLRVVLWQTELHVCHYCAVPLALREQELTAGVRLATADHIVPLSRRGPTIPWNAVLACQPCNFAKACSRPTCGCGRCRHAVRMVQERIDRLSRPRPQPQRALYDWVDPTLRRAALSMLAAMS